MSVDANGNLVAKCLETYSHQESSPEFAYLARFPSAGLARVAVLALSCSINQRPAGPGGLSVRNTADIGMTRLASGTSSRFIFTSERLAKSVWITSIGIAPQPRPARKKACFAPRSASRQVFEEKTPNSFPCDSSERSVRTSCLCCARTVAGIGPFSVARGCFGEATKSILTPNKRSRVSWEGAVGREPITPKEQRPS